MTSEVVSGGRERNVTKGIVKHLDVIVVVQLRVHIFKIAFVLLFSKVLFNSKHVEGRSNFKLSLCINHCKFHYVATLLCHTRH